MVSPPCDAVVCKGLLSFHVAHFLTSHPHTSMPIVHKMNKRQSLTWRPRNAGGNRSKSFTAPGSCATYHDGCMVLNFGFFVMDLVMVCLHNRNQRCVLTAPVHHPPRCAHIIIDTLSFVGLPSRELITVYTQKVRHCVTFVSVRCLEQRTELWYCGAAIDALKGRRGVILARTPHHGITNK